MSRSVLTRTEAIPAPVTLASLSAAMDSAAPVSAISADHLLQAFSLGSERSKGREFGG